MKPLFLSFQAFGPYLEKSEVDFSKLDNAPLFLICGPTGGGKTSILDAMCFALYCRATGGKRDFKSMRCSSAPQDSPTSVDFQFALGNREYRFLRSLYYHINRRTKQPESREIHECHVKAPDGNWQLLESGAEANVRKQAELLLHLTCEQFSQVIVLPQGDFLRLLRANSKEKGDMLKTLFAAEIWQKVTDNAAGRLKKLDAESRDFQARRSSLLEQAACATTQELNTAMETAKTTRAAFEKAQERFVKDTAAASETLALAQTYLRLKTALTETAAVQAAAQQQANLTEKTLAHLSTAKEDAANLRTQANLAGKEAARLQQYADALKKAALSEQQAVEKQKLAETADMELEKEAGQIAELEKRIVQGRGFIIETEKAAESLSELLAAQTAFETAQQAYQQLHLQRDKLSSLLAQQEKLSLAAHRQALLCADLDKQLKKQLDIRQNDTAFTLAQDLREGSPCPVCGAVHHPSPAEAGNGTMKHETFQTLQQSVQDAAKTLQKYQLALENTEKEKKEMQALTQQQEILCRELSPLAEADLNSAAQAGKISVEAARQAAGKLQRAREKVEQLSNEREAVMGVQSKRKEQSASFRAEAEILRKSAAETRAALPGIQLIALQKKQQLLEQEELRLNKEAQAISDSFEQALAAESRAKAVLFAAKAEQEKAETAFASLQTPWTAETQPDISALQIRLRELQQESLTNSTRLGNAQTHLSTLTAALKSITQLDESLLGIQARYETAARLSRSLSGSNAYKMPILQYVLSMMLDEILVSANAFFGRLSRGRYALRRVTGQTTGNALRGLDLEVLDGFSMTPRSIETLSGGEQFLASLSLAFGLSDVVQNYSGAVRLDALFIDEGFGTLDAETLDVAMKALRALHEGGRTAGIISHVAELRNRIPTRIEIYRDSAGHAALKIFAEH